MEDSSRRNGGSATVATYLVFLVLVVAGPVVVESKLRRYSFHLQEELRSPDCFLRPVITVNGIFPGPNLEVEVEDVVVVHVINNLTEATTIHWHGIKQQSTCWADGTEGVTQCPILPGSVFTYKFIPDKAGTLLWHAHISMQRMSGCYGMIKISPIPRTVPPVTYHEDRMILLGDWYHKGHQELAAGLLSVPFQWVGEPNSILMNGRGKFNCSSLSSGSGTCNPGSRDCSTDVVHVIPGKIYRLRIGSLTSLAALSFQIEGHNMTVVETDGNNVVPLNVTNLYIYSGETYSVHISTNRDPNRNYWMTANVVSRNSTTPMGTMILQYKLGSRTESPEGPPPPGPKWNDIQSRIDQGKRTRALTPFVPGPPRAAKWTIILLNTQNRVDNKTKWAMNAVSHVMPEIPYLIAEKKKMLGAFNQTRLPDTYKDMDNYDIYSVQKNQNAVASSAVYRLEFMSVVDVILQNANALAPNTSELHPWHLHGHDFWVLGFGEGKFKRSDSRSFNLKNPALKNTVALHQYGWTAVRFIASNPGAWALHCHIDSHFLMGMAVVFSVAPERVGRLPSTILGCVKT